MAVNRGEFSFEKVSLEIMPVVLRLSLEVKEPSFSRGGIQFSPYPICRITYTLRRQAHPKTSKPATTKTTTSAVPVPDKPGWASAPAVGVAPGRMVGNSWVEVGLTGVCVFVEVTLGRAGTGVSVAGGVTRRSSCCPGWMMEAEVSPFQAISSARLISYRSAIQARNSPLLTM